MALSPHVPPVGDPGPSAAGQNPGPTSLFNCVCSFSSGVSIVQVPCIFAVNMFCSRPRSFFLENCKIVQSHIIYFVPVRHKNILQ